MKPAATAFRHVFHEPRLYEQALTHRSVGRHNNERLEFLGDALVNLLVAELIYEHYPKADEGEMTRLRAALVSERALAEVAREEQVGDVLHLGIGELKSGGFRRDSILADACEALIAAIYLDAGWEACRTAIRQLFAVRMATIQSKVSKDPKTRLQEWLQAKGIALPLYELIASVGEEHAKTFEVACTIEAESIQTKGLGASRRAAEQAAAEQVLTLLEMRE